MNSNGQLIKFIISNTSTVSGLSQLSKLTLSTNKDEVFKHMNKTEVIKEAHNKIHRVAPIRRRHHHRGTITYINKKN
jgi:hypothetical protein